MTTPDYSQAARRRLREAARAAALLERAARRVTAPGRNVAFPYRAPSLPRGVQVPEKAPALGADYDTEWARLAGRPGRPRRDRRGAAAPRRPWPRRA